jgi:hypothetical protein
MPASPVPASDHAGVASSLVNVGQQVGGAIGPALADTLACSAVASSLRSQAGAAAKAGVHASSAVQTRMDDHAGHQALPGYLVSASILVFPLVIALAVIRVSHQDLSGTGAGADR